jgi:hypothetical protein
MNPNREVNPSRIKCVGEFPNPKIHHELIEKHRATQINHPANNIRLYRLEEDPYKEILASLAVEVQGYVQQHKLTLVGVLGILKSGRIPAEYIATFFDIKPMFLEIHFLPPNDDRVIHTLRKNRFGYLPHKIQNRGIYLPEEQSFGLQALSPRSVDRSHAILIVDDATTAGNNTHFASQLIREITGNNLTLLHAAVTNSIYFPPTGNPSRPGLDYEQTFCFLREDTYRVVSPHTRWREDILPGSLFPYFKDQGNTDQFARRLAFGRGIHSATPVYRARRKMNSNYKK